MADEIKGLDSLLNVFIKISSKERLEEIQNGHLYMNRVGYFQDLETNDDDDDDTMGDKYDGSIALKSYRLTITPDNSNNGQAEPVLTIPITRLSSGYKNTPIFCMFTMDIRNLSHTDIRPDEMTGIIDYTFTPNQIEKFHSFGDYGLVITNTIEFLSRIDSAFERIRMGSRRGLVTYYDENTNNLNILKSVMEHSSDIAFFKRKKYAYQQEYRILAYTNVMDHMEFDIGDIHDISAIIPLSQLLNCKLTLDCELTPLED